MPPQWQGLMWGILPFGSSLLAILVLFIPDQQRGKRQANNPFANEETLVQGRMAS
jgi:hypothetical protein